jgi:hypothetical protein
LTNSNNLWDLRVEVVSGLPVVTSILDLNKIEKIPLVYDNSKGIFFDQRF